MYRRVFPIIDPVATGKNIVRLRQARGMTVKDTIEIVASKSGSRDTPVWCMVFDELQYREEAHIFAEQQKHVKSLVPYEVFNAHLEAGDEKQLMIVDLVHGASSGG